MSDADRTNRQEGDDDRPHGMEAVRGIWRGRLKQRDDLLEPDDEIADLFEGESADPPTRPRRRPAP